MTIWYDFTTSLRNTGRNGIANVEWSVGHALADVDPSVRCFALKGNRALVEIDPAKDLAAALYASPVTASTSTLADSALTDRLRSGIRSRFGINSDPIIRAMSSLYQALVAARAAVARRSRAIAERASLRATIDDLVRPDDVVVSMGADWSGELAAALLRLKQSTGCRVVTMVYDLIPLTHTHLAFHKDRSLFERYYAGLLRCSDLITCISEQSRQDLLAFAESRNVAPRGTAVLRLGEGYSDRPRRAVPRDDFYLWVGTIERRKNLELLYDALRILDSEGTPLPKLVVAGAPGWGVDDLVNEIRLQSTPASRAIVMLGAVSEDDLDGLYSRARALLFPSHYEGWGLPVREAAVHGCPVAAGDSPAVREALRGYAAAVLLPVDDPEPWAAYMRQPPRPATPVAPHTWSQTARALRVLIGEQPEIGGRFEASR